MEREITITDNFMFATVMKGESIKKALMSLESGTHITFAPRIARQFLFTEYI